MTQDAQIVKSDWVFKYKYNPDNTIECSRIVVKGY